MIIQKIFTVSYILKVDNIMNCIKDQIPDTYASLTNFT